LVSAVALFKTVQQSLWNDQIKGSVRTGSNQDS
jgi:hypothetical protein